MTLVLMVGLYERKWRESGRKHRKVRMFAACCVVEYLVDLEKFTEAHEHTDCSFRLISSSYGSNATT